MRRLRCSKANVDVSKIQYKYYVFDTETTCLEPMAKNFVFGCIYGHNTRKVIYSVEEFIEEFNRPKYKDKYIFAHNAEFDLLTIFGNIFLKIDTAAIFNGKFISAKYKDLMFADSMNIYPTSVAKLGELIGMPKLENQKVKDGKLTKRNMTQQDIEYCMRDCEIVYRSLLRVFEMSKAIKLTLPSLAMFDFRHNYLEEDLQFSDLVDEFYESYYGGRTEAFYIGKCQARSYDINSLYPKAMATVTFPDVKRLCKTENADVSYLQFCLDHYEGMADVTVVHKETFFGYLPCRMELNRTTKLVFPVGEFRTTVNFNELRFAIQQDVVKVKKVHKIIYGNPIASIFTDYIEDNFRKRQEATTVLDSTIYKLKMNSLYGRFAMRMKMTTTYYEMIPFNLITELKEADKYCDVKLFNATRADCFLVTENEQFKNSFFSIPTLSSYVTSEARILLLKTLIANENNRVVYCDTDSVFVRDAFVGKISNELGAFKIEKCAVTEIRGLKNYTYIDEKTGEERIVIKGISRGSIKTGTNAQGETTYASQRYYKTKASLRQHHEAGEAYTLVKTIRNTYDKREILDNGETRALIIREGVAINATTFIRKARPSKKKPRFRYEPVNAREAIMMFFITGGKVWTQDMKAHITGNDNRELRHYFGLYAADGAHMDVFCEKMPDEFYTDKIIDEFQDVLREFNSAAKMREYLEEQAEKNHIERVKKLTEYEFEYDTPF